MWIVFRTIGLLAICCLLMLPVRGAEQGSGGRVEQARTFIEQLNRREASKAVREFDAVMAKALSAERLQALWVSLEQQHGPFQKILSTRVEIKAPYEIVLVSCQFEKKRVMARVVYAKNNQISGLFFKPDGEYQRPGYVDPRKFTEEPVVIGKGLWELPGTLSLPVGEGPFPAVILVQLDGKVTREEQAQLDALAVQVERVRSTELSESVSAVDLPLGVPASYWQDLRGYQPAQAARTLSQPLLILQGERDYQVTMEDFRLWKETLAERKDVRLRSYPGLNHLLMAGEGKGLSAEYLVPGHVAEKVIQDIADWVKALRP